MADTINVPGLGPTRAVYVYVGGALVVGIVGYAWYKNQQATPTDFVGASPDDYATGDYDSPLGNSGGNSTGNFDSTDPNAITTNAEWTAFVVEKLASYNYDAATVSAALGKYLARQGLTEQEISIVQQAIAVAGLPPVGGPYPISPALPPNPTTKPYVLYYKQGSSPPVWGLAGGSEKWQETGSQQQANAWAAKYMPGLNAFTVSPAEYQVQKTKYQSGN